MEAPQPPVRITPEPPEAEREALLAVVTASARGRAAGHDLWAEAGLREATERAADADP